MGTFEIKIGVAALTSGEFIEAKALVDTGATYTLLPRSLLKKINVQPIDSILLQLADERVVNYEVGQVQVRLDGRERIVLVVFGEQNASPLIDATTLDLFSLGVDPVNRRLFPVVGLMK